MPQMILLGKLSVHLINSPLFYLHLVTQRQVSLNIRLPTPANSNTVPAQSSASTASSPISPQSSPSVSPPLPAATATSSITSSSSYSSQPTTSASTSPDDTETVVTSDDIRDILDEQLHAWTDAMDDNELEAVSSVEKASGDIDPRML